MKVTAREWLLCLVGLIATAGVASWGIGQHDERVRREAQLTDTIHRLNVRETTLEASIGDARLHVAATAETVTVTRTAYRNVRDTIVLAPLTLADTVKDIRALPELVRTADNALAADSAHQAAATKLQSESDSLVEAQRSELDLWRKAKVITLPRVTRSVAALYDAIAATPMASAQISVRTIGTVDLVARADQRFGVGEKPRLYVGVSVGM
jgi:hypothetical protein